MSNKELQSMVYFGHDRDDVAVVRRIVSFQKAGLNVQGITFNRGNQKDKSSHKWKNLDLGYVKDAKLLNRLLVLMRAVMGVFRNRKMIRQTDILYARNLDMFLLAWTAKLFTPFSNVIMVYESLDIHESLTKGSVFSKILRWVERRVLARCDLLVISSHGFMKYYFKPVQKYTGNCFLVENKLYFENDVAKRPIASSINHPDKRPLRLVWAGILRCKKALEIIKSLATAMGDNIEIHLWGEMDAIQIPDFAEQIAEYNNITYLGRYKWPQGLSEVYQEADLAWSQVFMWANNADWLIPNRVYEASYFGVLSLAIAGTQTGDFVSENDLGYVIPNSEIKTIVDYIQRLSIADIVDRRKELLAQPADNFIVVNDDIIKLVEAIRLSSESTLEDCELTLKG
jgi:succinoglycan biosynthesis protein ExoL